MNNQQPLTDQQLDDLDDFLNGPTGTSALVEAKTARRLVAEVRRLRDELAGRGTPVAGGVAAPTPSRAYLEMELKRNELDKGFTDQEWAVGGVVCPEGFSCVSHPLTIFRPTKKGRLPVHRHEQFGIACSGSGQKPTTPPLQLHPAVEETQVVADGSDDPEHVDDCPGCETGTRPCGHDDYHDPHEWADRPGIWCPGHSLTDAVPAATEEQQ